MKLPATLFALVTAASLSVGLPVFVGLLWHESEPCPRAEAPSGWPPSSRLERPRGPALLLFAHPKCPCTVASIGELARLLAHAPGATAIVAFLEPEGVEPGWVRTASWTAAERLPGVRVVADRAGAEARLFGALTSGDVRVYDASGRLAFAGGITANRGCVGDNAGAAAALACLRAAEPAHHELPVFGCSLFESNGGVR